MSEPGHARWVVPLWGALAAVLAAPLAAALVAGIYRFPVPFADYARGWSGAGDAALASVFYLVLGGVIVLAAGGAVGGWLIQRAVAPCSTRAAGLTTVSAFGVAAVAAVVLATLEFLIGPW
ncbi:hypothetical protein [Nocardia sp. BMG51109]|uniref:hypothetical protein n=1 Tax=Nocardia sp. BMG51109 TaxID=1056816 RepID=UPI00046379CF|nr:hypothetical protein [Nocardia sp. BMG51109]